jgi:nucleoside-triphosphatase THEP1
VLEIADGKSTQLFETFRSLIANKVGKYYVWIATLSSVVSDVVRRGFAKRAPPKLERDGSLFGY